MTTNSDADNSLLRNLREISARQRITSPITDLLEQYFAKADVASLYPSLMRTYRIGPARDPLGALLALVDRLVVQRLAAKDALVKEASEKLVASERYGRADPSVQAQALKVISAKPDAVFVGASGTPAAMPQITLRERGFKGRIYQSHGVTSKEFLRVGGKNVEGALIPVGPVLVAEQLPDSHPSKKSAVAFVQTLEAKYGADSRSTFAGASWDAWLLLQNAITGAQKAKIKSGTYLGTKGEVHPGLQWYPVPKEDNIPDYIDWGDLNGESIFTMTHRTDDWGDRVLYS